MKLILRLIGLKMSILRVDAAIINPKTVKPNGWAKGTFSVESICGLLKSWNDYIHILACHIHHIMFWKRKNLLFLCASIKTQYTFFLHDYYMICESCNLLKNDLLFCGADLPNKKKCDGCKYFDGYFQRKEWLAMDRLFWRHGKNWNMLGMDLLLTIVMCSAMRMIGL